MSVNALVLGLLGLIAILMAAGLIGGIGVVELIIWHCLVAAWILWWARSRKAGPARP